MASNWVTSNTLLDRARAADQSAWHRLVLLYTPLVRYWCGQQGYIGHDAEDLAQDVFAAVAAQLASFDKQRPGATFRGWLRGITRHKVLDAHRRGRGPAAAGGTDAHLALQRLAADETRDDDDPPALVTELFHRALELVRCEFEARTWQAFWRAAVDGHAVADIAKDMGISTAAVRQAKSRILRRLKDEVGDLLA